MIFDSGIGDHERIFIFASELCLQCLAESEHWYADITFKVSPELFFQLYAIHGQQRGNIFPCVFGCCRIRRRQHTQGFSERYLVKLMNQSQSSRTF